MGFRLQLFDDHQFFLQRARARVLQAMIMGLLDDQVLDWSDTH